MSLKINGQRLRSHLECLAKIGYREGAGITRLAYSREDVQAHEYVAGLMREAGLQVSYDLAWNLIGRWEPTLAQEDRHAWAASSGESVWPKKTSRPAIVMGSHLDTVPQGGPFDGALGVLGAVEVAQTIIENGWSLKRPLEVIAFANEEGSLVGGTFGSQAMAGSLSEEEMTLLQDEKSSLARAYLNLGLDPKLVPSAKRDREFAAAYLELHIEQGDVLEGLGIPIGIVQGIVGIRRYEITVHGRAGHAGATPMARREDALVRAAQLVLDINEKARSSGPGTVATVGRIQASPGAFNVIPGRVNLYAEVRSLDLKTLEDFETHLYRRVEGLGALAVVLRKDPVAMDRVVMGHVEAACEALRVRYQLIPSGAGHDAMNMAAMAPAGMIFVPSRAGLSHVPEEWTDWEHVILGTQVLLESCLAVASHE